MTTKKTPKKKVGPGRGGKRPGAGRPPGTGKTVVLSIRVSNETKARIIAAAGTRGMTPGDLISEWSRLLWVPES